MIQVISTKILDTQKRMGKTLESSKTQLKFHVRKKEEMKKVFRDKKEKLAAEFFKKKGVNKEHMMKYICYYCY